jgi:hypothetical protein
MNEVFIIVSGEIYTSPKIEAVFKYEWLANVYAVDLANKYNENVNFQYADSLIEDFMMVRNPMVQREKTEQTIEYWENEVDFIRIDKWEVQ